MPRFYSGHFGLAKLVARLDTVIKDDRFQFAILLIDKDETVLQSEDADANRFALVPVLPGGAERAICFDLPFAGICLWTVVWFIGELAFEFAIFVEEAGEGVCY